MLVSPIFFGFPVFPLTPFAAKSCHFFWPRSSTFFCSSFLPFLTGFPDSSFAILSLLASASSAFIAAGCDIMAALEAAPPIGDIVDTLGDSSFRFLLAACPPGLMSLG